MTDDIALVALITGANAQTERVDPGARQGVTLFVRGQIITGFVIPAWQMMEDLGRGGQDQGPFAALAPQLRKQEQRKSELQAKEIGALTDEEDEFLDLDATFVREPRKRTMAGRRRSAPPRH